MAKTIPELEAWRKKMGLVCSIEGLIRGGVQVGLLSSEQEIQTTEKFKADFKGYLNIPDSIIWITVKAALTRGCDPVPSETFFISNCIPLVSKQLEAAEEEIVAIAQKMHVSPATIFVAFAAYIKETAVKNGFLAPTPVKKSNYNKWLVLPESEVLALTVGQEIATDASRLAVRLSR